MPALSPLQLLKTHPNLETAVRIFSQNNHPLSADYAAFAQAMFNDPELSRATLKTDPELFTHLLKLDYMLLHDAPQTAQKVYRCTVKLLGLETPELEKIEKANKVATEWYLSEQLLYNLPEFISRIVNWILGITVDTHSQRQFIVLEYLRLIPSQKCDEKAIKYGLKLASLIDVAQTDTYVAFLEKVHELDPYDTFLFIEKLNAFLDNDQLPAAKKSDILFCLALLPKNQLAPADIINQVEELLTPGANAINLDDLNRDLLTTMSLLDEADLSLANFKTIKNFFESIHEELRKDLIEILENGDPNARFDILNVMIAENFASNQKNLRKIMMLPKEARPLVLHYLHLQEATMISSSTGLQYAERLAMLPGTAHAELLVKVKNSPRKTQTVQAINGLLDHPSGQIQAEILNAAALLPATRLNPQAISDLGLYLKAIDDPDLKADVLRAFALLAEANREARDIHNLTVLIYPYIKASSTKAREATFRRFELLPETERTLPKLKEMVAHQN